MLTGDDQANRGTEGFPLKHAREDFHPIFFWPGADQGTLPRPSPIKLLLDGLKIEIHPWPDSLDDDTHGLPVALAKSQNLESFTETV